MTLLARLKTSTAVAGRRLLGAMLGLGIAAAVIAPPARAWAEQPMSVAAKMTRDQASGPALWVVRDADSTIYLFGTVHVLRPTTLWASDRVDAALASADQVWFELANPDDQVAALPLIQAYGLSPDRPLSSRLTPDELVKFDAAARTVGASAAAFDQMRPWLAALTLGMAPLVKAGYDPKSGVELTLREKVLQANKPLHGLETMDEQIRILAGLSEETQLDFLRSTLDSFEDATRELDGMVDAWATGDVEALEKLGVDDIREDSEEVYQAMLARRNANWAGQIKTLLDGSGTAFIAVGAAHLAGPDSVQAQLERLRIEVDRVED